MVLSLTVSYSNLVLHSPGEIHVNLFGHSGHLDHLVSDIRKRQKNTYDSQEISRLSVW